VDDDTVEVVVDGEGKVVELLGNTK